MDLALVHPPHLIALACIYIASVLREKDTTAWFEELRVDMNVVSLSDVSTSFHYFLSTYFMFCVRRDPNLAHQLTEDIRLIMRRSFYSYPGN